MKSFVIFIFLNLVCFSYFSAQAISSTAQRIPVKPDPVEHSVWQVHTPYGQETGFFVDKDRFVARLGALSHVIKQNKLEHISLSQEGSTTSLKIRDVIAVSALYDLIMVETDKTSLSHLNLREQPPKLSEHFSAPVYLKTFKTIKTTRNILHENKTVLYFPLQLFGA